MGFLELPGLLVQLGYLIFRFTRVTSSTRSTRNILVLLEQLLCT
jgi:hypothetical protein